MYEPESKDKDKGGAKTGGKDAYKKLLEMKEEKKLIDVINKMVSYEEFMTSLKVLKDYDLMMNRLKLTKSSTYAEEVSLIIEKEEYHKS
jgi:predicted CopG family antitoxin